MDLSSELDPRQDDPVSSDAARPNDYSTASIKIVSFEDSVRARPQIYFGCTREDPALVTAVALAVVADALYEPSVGRVDVTVLIESDLRFTVADNSPAIRLGPDGQPQSGFFESVLDRRRWAPAAAAALSRGTWIEVGVHDRTWRQELAGATVVGPPREGPAGHVGTRVTFELDAGYFAAGAVLSREPGAFRTGENGQALPGAGGIVTITDLRPKPD
jgi:DNA gyrase/topoisomerase IV subunit B